MKIKPYWNYQRKKMIKTFDQIRGEIIVYIAALELNPSLNDEQRIERIKQYIRTMKEKMTNGGL